VIEAKMPPLDVLRTDCRQLLDEVVAIATPPYREDAKAAMSAIAEQIVERLGAVA
jgi:hypothetical protein